MAGPIVAGSGVRDVGPEPCGNPVAEEAMNQRQITGERPASSLAAGPAAQTVAKSQEIPGPPAPQAPEAAQPTQTLATAAVSPVPPAPPVDVPAEINEQEVVIRLCDRRWRVRGLARNMSFEQLKSTSSSVSTAIQIASTSTPSTSTPPSSAQPSSARPPPSSGSRRHRQERPRHGALEARGAARAADPRRPRAQEDHRHRRRSRPPGRTEPAQRPAPARAHRCRLLDTAASSVNRPTSSSATSPPSPASSSTRWR